MIEVVKDNIRDVTYFTECKTCRSELKYNYDDVVFEKLPYSFTPNRKILCPVCNNTTNAELVTEENYGSFTPFIPNLPPMWDSCCCSGEEAK